MVDNWNFYFSNCSLGRFAWDKHHRLPLQIFQLHRVPQVVLVKCKHGLIQLWLPRSISIRTSITEPEVLLHAQWKLRIMHSGNLIMHLVIWIKWVFVCIVNVGCLTNCGAVFCSELKWWWVRCYIFQCISIIYSCAASNLSNQSLSWVCKYYMIYYHIIKPLRKCYWTACCGNENSETSSQKGQKPF